jgi:tight adherence protein B
VAALEGARQLIRWSKEKKAEELRRRLRAIGQDEPGVGTTLLREGKLSSTPALDALLRTLPFALRIERLLEQADARVTVAQIIGWSVLAAIAGIAAAGVLGLGLALGILFATMGAMTPCALLLSGRGRRSRKVSEQLPEALDMMSRSLRAGHAFTSAFEVVAQEMPEPVAVEFGRAYEAQRLGLPVEEAIVQMTERVPGNRDLKIFSVSVTIQKETGGNLAEILGNIAETIRSRYKFYGKLRGLTAEGRASAVVLALLPIAMTLLLRVLNPEYLVPLAATSGGHKIVLVAATLWGGGLLWLYGLTKVDI